MASIKRLNLDADPEISHHLRHRTKHSWRICHHVVRFREVHRPAIKSTDLRQALSDMGHTLRRSRHVSTVFIQRQWTFDVPKNHIAAHSSRQVDYHIDIGIADTVYHFTKKFFLPARLSGLGVAHVTMHDGGTRLGRIDSAGSDLFR